MEIMSACQVLFWFSFTNCLHFRVKVAVRQEMTKKRSKVAGWVALESAGNCALIIQSILPSVTTTEKRKTKQKVTATLTVKLT